MFFMDLHKVVGDQSVGNLASWNQQGSSYGWAIKAFIHKYKK